MNVEQIFLNGYQRYRHFIVPFLLILVLGFFVDLKPLLMEWREREEQASHLSQQLKEKELALQQAHLLLQFWHSFYQENNKSPWMIKMIQLAQQRFCEVRNFQTEFQAHDQALNPLRIKILLGGDFFCFYRFLTALIEAGLPLQLDQFSLKTEKDGIEINTQFSAFPWVDGTMARSESESSLKPVTCCQRDPFAEPKTALIEQHLITEDPFEKLTIDELHYVGFFSEAGKTVALLLLPNGQSYEAHRGSKLGRRAWLVVSIKPAYLMLQDDENKTIRRISRGSP